MLANCLSSQSRVRLGQSYRDFVTPAGLVTYGILANALFWSGLLLPYDTNTAPEIAYLHVFIALMGFAIAFGGAAATLMFVSNKISVPYYCLEFFAGLMNIFVLSTGGTLMVHTLIRGL